MPISQKTILAIYGSLVTVVEKIEQLDTAARQPDLWTEGAPDGAALLEELGRLRRWAYSVQQDAIAQLMHDDPRIEVNPITGKLL